MKVGFIGVGKLGQDAAEVMAEKHDVIGYDVVDVSPYNFKMVDSVEEVCKGREIIFIAVPTPHHPDYDGRYPTAHLPNKDFDYSIVRGVLSEVNKYANKEQLVVLISTVLPGTTRRELIQLCDNFRFIYNPYLIAMGTVKWDMVNPEMVIIGTEDGSMTGDAKLLIDFYKTFIIEGARYEVGTWDEAECIKIFYNTFISTKISLVNMIQDVAEKGGNINADVVANAIKRSDYRIISPMYLTPGMGDGGGCVLPSFNVKINGDVLNIKDFYERFHNTNEDYLAESANYTCNTKNQKKVFDVTKRKYRDTLYTLTTETGKKIKLTKDQLIPVERKRKRLIIRVDEIVHGDKLFIL
jgi:UDPglucose 6-dehydrogenase